MLCRVPAAGAHSVKDHWPSHSASEPGTLSPEEFVKMQTSGPRASDSLCLNCSLRMCISYEFPGDAGAAGPGLNLRTSKPVRSASVALL